ncbi:MAG: UDP-N-acetylmuramoyl-L-alanyl-D-glutamate--2,6-diaminopimelate ligase [Dehalococcoidia bacterium]|nr:UDP-N-acetylmuramoyl-L-alanyl-D-glutamate--2,6-diaminopimelate ligase [Dehalococcoidia bacterium]
MVTLAQYPRQPRPVGAAGRRPPGRQPLTSIDARIARRLTVRLTEITQHMDGARHISGPADAEVRSLQHDSRQVGPGALFIAVRGFATDGHRFVGDAIARSAVALLVENEPAPGQVSDGVAVYAVPDSRRALADAAAAFHGFPAKRLKVVGITGTKGKTTTTYLASAVLEAAGLSTGLLSSVEFKIGDRFEVNGSQFTTPESLEVQALLARLVEAGAEYAVVESTSHGLKLDRLRNVEYDVGVFTNLYADHMDFHPDMDDYLRSKALLFRWLDESEDKGIPKTAILNADDPNSNYLREQTAKARLITYGVKALDADVTAPGAELSDRGSRFKLLTPAGSIWIDSPLPGLFNVYNSLAAAAVGFSQGLSLDAIAAGLHSVSGVPGRVERIESGQPFGVIVDYAHMPESLTSVLQALRPLTIGRLITVFGCGGDRDPGRRTGMGKAAAENSDFTVICNDNPRTEDPVQIIQAIADAMLAAGRHEGKDFVRIPDRRDAMRFAFENARAGDVVLVAGKGHEPYLIVGHEYLPWADREVARQVLGQLGWQAASAAVHA